MPPRRNTREPVPMPATVGTGPQTTQGWPSERSQPTAPGTGETFYLANISGSEEDEDDQRPTQPPTGTQPTIPGSGSGINNLTIVAPRDSKNQAVDVHYFFEKLPDKYQCKTCQYVFHNFNWLFV